MPKKVYAKTVTLTLDTFICQVYLPHARLCKRSWQMDERIARKLISPVFGPRALGSLTSGEIENWCARLLARGYARSSCNRFLAVFKSILALARQNGLFASSIRIRPFGGVTGRERYLSQAEGQRLMQKLAASSACEARALELLVLTGARKNEILKARWEHVNLEQGILIVPISKSGKRRQIVLSAAAVAVLQKLARKTDWLFPARGGDKPLNDLYYFWNRTRRELGLGDVRIHDLRHTFASFLINNGHSLYEVQKLLGHADPRTTMRYAHLGRDVLAAAAQKVGGMLETS